MGLLNNDELNYFNKTYKSQLRNKQILNILFGTFSLIIGILGIVIRKEISYYFGAAPIILLFTASTLILFGVGSMLYYYLQYNRYFEYEHINNIDENEILNELEILKIEILSLKNAENKQDINDNINESINKIISQNLDNTKFIESLEAKFGNNISYETRTRRILKDIDSIDTRISREITRLTKSANINLAFGTVVTLFAVSFLGYEILYKEKEYNNLTSLLSHYIPRVSFVILIEVFAFFFLKIYKATLFDIKYYNNEKTNIDFKIIALKSAIANQDDELIKTVIEVFLTTERNFKLQKGESTIELEKEKIATKNELNLIEYFKEFIKINKDK